MKNDWKLFLYAAEASEIKTLERDLQAVKRTLNALSLRRAKIRNRVAMRIRYAQSTILGEKLGMPHREKGILVQ